MNVNVTGNGLVLAGHATPTALELPNDMSFDDWAEVGRKLGMIATGCQFWIGDWIRYGEDQAEWGEKYSQALDATGLDYSTLSNYVHVAKAIPPRERRPELSWSHHRATTSLLPAERRVLLDQAAANGWTKMRLEAEAKAEKTGGEVVEPETCSECGRVLPGGNK